MIQIQGHTPISKVTFFKWRKRTALDTEKRQWDMHLWRTGLKKQDKKRQVERYLCLFCGKSLGSGRAWGLSRRKCCCQDLLATFTGKWRTKHAAEIKWICSQGSMLRFICFICTEIRVGCCPSQTAPQPIPLQSRREAGWQLILHGLFHWLLTWTECTFSAVAFGQHWDSYHDLDLQKCACWVSSWMMAELPPQLAMDREKVHFSYANHMHIFSHIKNEK